ncbi:T9SS sorting signal type C domain-containing protein, partial [Flavobacterium sp. LB3R33]|uniref:T9SS sorting signal type C domain-containing protein n=1 Tax=Flavobacterium sp. LB3R33 TaxID=3401721 RepID=UPI003AAE0CF6
VTYTASATNNTGLTYGLDATTLAFAGNSIVAGTGVVTYAAGWSGTSTITVSAAGCNGPQIATHTVTITPTVGTPVFTLGESSIRCQGVGSVTYTASATNNTGLTYGLDATTLAFAGNSIVAGTGVVTYSAGWSGTSTITVSAAGCNGPQIASHTVTVNPLPTAPTFAEIDITQPDCKIPTGSVILRGLPPSGTINQTGTVINTYPITGSTLTITGLTPGTYNFSVFVGGCSSSPSGNVVIDPVTTATWNVVSGVGSWTDGPPTLSKALVFDGNYSENTDVVGCSCEVKSGTIKILDGKTMTITNGVSVSGSAALIFENNASLVQDNNSALNVGNIQYKRQTNIISKFDYTYWSSPVFNQRLLNVSPNTLFDKFFSFNASTDTWQQENTANLMEVGRGYIIRGPQFFPAPNPPSGIHEATFTGRPNNGVIGIPIPFISSETSNLIGNPYPSAIDADLFLAANNLILDGTLYFWTHNSPPSNAIPGDAIYNYTSNDYASYNGVGGVATLPAYLGGVTPSGKIAAGQAFFATGIAAGTAVFNNGMRVSGGALGVNNSQFFKTNNTKSKVTNSVEKHRIWLNLTNTQGAFKQTLLGYVTNATNGFDKAYDGQSFDGNEFVDFYSINDDKNLTIQGRALPFDKNDEVALGYSSTIEGAFSISIDKVDGILASEDVFIEDKTTNTIKNLKEGAYNFSTTAGSFNNRFVLRYKDKTLGTDDFDKTENQVLISKDKNELKIKSELESIKRITVFDLLGRKVFDKEAINSNEFSISNSTLNKQIVIVKVILTNGNVISKKVIY